MQSKALVSVLIPAYNDAKFVGQAIESVLAQSLRDDLEIIVVDDGSTDNTADVVRSFGSAVTLLQQQNAGVAAARNHAIRHASGEYIAFLDADDLWHPRKLEMQVGHLRHCGRCVAVYCNKQELRPDADGQWPEPQWRDEGLDAVCANPEQSGWLYRALLFDSIIHTTTIMVPKRIIDQIGWIDESLRKGEDLDYWLRLSRLGEIHMMDAVLSSYRIHPASLTHRVSNVNYHALVVERAVKRFGRADPAGVSIPREVLQRVLGTSWSSFAYQHLMHGSLPVARNGALHALRYQYANPRAWRLAARIGLASVLGVGRSGSSPN